MSGFRLTIGRRIGLGFAILIVFVVILVLTLFQNVESSSKAFEKSKALDEKVSNIYDPSKHIIGSIRENIQETKGLIQIWVCKESRSDNLNKERFRQLKNTAIPKMTDSLRVLKESWDDDYEIKLADRLLMQIDTLFSQYEIVTDNLQEMEDYQDMVKYFEADEMVAPSGPMLKLSDKVVLNLDDLYARYERKVRIANKEQIDSSEQTTDKLSTLLSLCIWLGIAVVVGAIVVSMFTTRSIVRPINQLKGMLVKMGRGVIPDNKMNLSNDEIGEMSAALNSMVEGYRQTTEFSNQVGSGNFDYDYQPLSNEDVLGHALLKMRDDLAENERILEQKVVERTEEVVRQRDEIERQRLKVEELYKDVTDSIRYAKRLQDSILPPERYIKELLPQSFVLFKPKDIVSGDFYWFEKTQNKVLFAAVDCTGHGVPGAFMSLVGANALNQAVREHQLATPSTILDDLNKLSSDSLNKHSEENSVRDGMDLAMCAIDKENRTLEYAGANNPLYIIRNNEIMVTKADKFAIGSMTGEKYTNHTIQLEEGDTIYVFSDGYADQFGGEKGKKFMYKKFRELLKSIKDLPMTEQKTILDNEIEAWKGSYEQIDDILVIGVKI